MQHLLTARIFTSSRYTLPLAHTITSFSSVVGLQLWKKTRHLPPSFPDASFSMQGVSPQELLLLADPHRLTHSHNDFQRLNNTLYSPHQSRTPRYSKSTSFSASCPQPASLPNHINDLSSRQSHSLIHHNHITCKNTAAPYTKQHETTLCRLRLETRNTYTINNTIPRQAQHYTGKTNSTSTASPPQHPPSRPSGRVRYLLTHQRSDTVPLITGGSRVTINTASWKAYRLTTHCQSPVDVSEYKIACV